MHLVSGTIEPASHGPRAETDAVDPSWAAATPTEDLPATTSTGTGDDEVDGLLAEFDSAGGHLDDVIAAGEHARERLVARLEEGAEDG